MATRIYSLAKDLGLDNKELVEIVKKAGIAGKGSALASLEDDEVERIRHFMAEGDNQASNEPPPSMSRPEPTDRGNIKVVTTRSSSTAPLAPKPAEKETPLDDPAKTVEEEVETTSPDEPAPLSREDMMPMGNNNIKVITAGKSDESEEAEDPSKPREKKPRAPVIKLTQLPDVPQPTNEPPPTEGKVQQPEIRLSRDSKRPSRLGAGMPKTPANQIPELMDPEKLSQQTQKGRRGKSKEKEPNPGLTGMASARAERYNKRQRREQMTLQTDKRHRRRRRTLTRTGKNTAAPRKSRVVLELPCTVRSFSEAASIPSSEIQAVLMNLGLMVTINAQIDMEFVDLLAEELQVDLELRQQETLEDSLLAQIDQQEDPEESLASRPPVVTFLGHVDHGKTSLLDALMGIDVVSGEAGGITQHIRAYQIEKDGRQISFVDTPGHEAFTEMRARGANVTDIAVLVIAADDGIMPQTEEAISHLKAAEVPIVVALNKMDLPGANPEQAMTQLTQFELTPSEWGGDTEIVQTSAETGAGLDELLETILTIAELHEYRANPDRVANGICLEAEQESGRGVIAKVIVTNGTLNVGDVLVCGRTFGRVKAMYDTMDHSKLLEKALPATPVNITGFDTAPEAGDAFHVLEDISMAREIADQRIFRNREASLSGITTRISFEDFQQQLEDGTLAQSDEVAMINLIIRADVRGSIEAIKKEMEKLHHSEVQIRILQASVGGITSADIMLAHASKAVVVGFNVIPNDDARVLADEKQVEIRRYDIIYKLTEDIKALLEGQLKPEKRVVELGHAVVQRVFSISRLGNIAGCKVVRGAIQRGCRIRVNRDGRTIGDYPLDSLKREKDDAREVNRGMECGIKLSGFNDIKVDDVLEAYEIEEIARTL
ncbi:MAG: translation initiation factor IF-2 [Pirellulaceae bacterium]